MQNSPFAVVPPQQNAHRQPDRAELHQIVMAPPLRRIAAVVQWEE